MNRSWHHLNIWLLAVALTATATNFEEAEVGRYTLPDPLVCLDGTPVKTPALWWEKRRPEILIQYRRDIFGYCSTPGTNVTFNVWEQATNALNGRAVRKQVELNLSGTPDGPLVHLLLYTPAGRPAAPTFLCLSFNGNYQAIDDPAIAIFPEWNNKTRQLAIPANPVRGGGSRNWKITETLARGYGIALLDYQEIEPDLPHGLGFKYGLHKIYPTSPTNDWGAISAWAWGASRALDYLLTDPAVDKTKVILFGHSRLGKTALWAGAQDTRFAAVIANGSGEMGAALSRRNYGESVDDVCKHFPYWMSAHFQQYANHWNDLPVDAHELITLIAPRPLFLNSGSEDLWADPRGEFLAARAASPVYALLGQTGLTETNFPDLEQPLKHTIWLNCHRGKHDVLPSDWDKFLDFADAHFSQTAGQK